MRPLNFHFATQAKICLMPVLACSRNC